jgi:hypothetical protein
MGDQKYVGGTVATMTSESLGQLALPSLSTRSIASKLIKNDNRARDRDFISASDLISFEDRGLLYRTQMQRSTKKRTKKDPKNIAKNHSKIGLKR